MKISKRNLNFLALINGLIVLIVMSACESEPPTLPVENVIDGVVGDIKTLSSGPPVFTATNFEAVPTGGGTFLYVGAGDNKSAATLVKFTNLPQSIQVNGAELELRSTSNMGIINGNVDVTIHKVNDDWVDSTVTADTFGNAFDPAIMSTFSFTVADTDTVVVPLDKTVIQGWIDGTIENHGLYIQAPGAAYFKRINSRLANDNRPVLRLFHEKEGVKDTTVFTASDDAFVFNLQQEPVQGPLYVGNGLEHRSILRFDFSTIPRYANINLAILTLQIDTLNSFLSKDAIFTFSIDAITKAAGDPEGVTLNDFEDPFNDSLATRRTSLFAFSYAVLDTSETITVDLTPLMQNWTWNKYSNNGLVVVSRQNNLDLYRTAFFSKETRPEKAPSVKVYYTVPADNDPGN